MNVSDTLRAAKLIGLRNAMQDNVNRILGADLVITTNEDQPMKIEVAKDYRDTIRSQIVADLNAQISAYNEQIAAFGVELY